MARPYMAPISIGATTAQVDIFEILAASGKPLELCGFELGQTSELGEAQEEQLELVLKYVTGAPTSGSGGGTSTFVTAGNNTAAGAAIETGNTTKLTGGTSSALARFAWNIRAERTFLPTPEFFWPCDAGARLVLELVTTPADSIGGIVGWVAIRELV